MNDLHEKFLKLDLSKRDIQYPIPTKSAIKAYYGISQNGCYRIAFLSTKSTQLTGSTKNIAVSQGATSDHTYWTCFDLAVTSMLSTFCIFGEDLISSIQNEKDEQTASSTLRHRFNTWVALFKKTRSPLSPERAKGLFGELYFLKAHVLPKYGEEDAIRGWGGPEALSKDFSIGEDWYEVKTVSCGAAVVKIASLIQLSSDTDGVLAVVHVEPMSDQWTGEDSTINILCQEILSSLNSSELRDVFLNKLSELGYEFSDELGDKKYRVEKVVSYSVSGDFPVLHMSDIKSDAIANVSYELLLNKINEYIIKEEE